MRVDLCEQSVETILDYHINKLRQKANRLEKLKDEIDYNKLSDQSEKLLIDLLTKREEL